MQVTAIVLPLNRLNVTRMKYDIWSVYYYVTILLKRIPVFWMEMLNLTVTTPVNRSVRVCFGASHTRASRFDGQREAVESLETSVILYFASTDRSSSDFACTSPFPWWVAARMRGWGVNTSYTKSVHVLTSLGNTSTSSNAVIWSFWGMWAHGLVTKTFHTQLVKCCSVLFFFYFFVGPVGFFKYG